jgi:hypothetical protein
MTHKPKSWLWRLTFPFAHGNYTTIGSTIYYPKKLGKATGFVLEHEKYHIRQQAEVGTVKFVLLYLFCLPVLFNPWRKKWETEAYILGSMWTQTQTRKVLRSAAYGWIL